MRSLQLQLKKKRGFTLIELLVVISIIALLTTVILASVNDARKKARDARRLQDARAIKTALDAYHTDFGKYPQSSWVSSNQAAWETGTLGTALQAYLPTMPVDPTNVPTGTAYSAGVLTYSYYANGNGSAAGNQQWYMLVFNLEGTNNPIRTRDGSIACDGTPYTYGNAVVFGGNCAN